jgi:hypothetical protein
VTAVVIRDVIKGTFCNSEIIIDMTILENDLRGTFNWGLVVIVGTTAVNWSYRVMKGYSWTVLTSTDFMEQNNDAVRLMSRRRVIACLTPVAYPGNFFWGGGVYTRNFFWGVYTRNFFGGFTPGIFSGILHQEFFGGFLHREFFGGSHQEFFEGLHHEFFGGFTQGVFLEGYTRNFWGVLHQEFFWDSTNSVEDREQTERGSGAVAP